MSITKIGWFLVALLFAGGVLYAVLHEQSENTMAATPKSVSPGCEFATFGGGCFWCLEATFELLNGVERVESGYTGGALKNPTYQQVCSGTTDHAEVVQIAYDPKIISYRDLLNVFFVMHDPTTLNRQGHDVGTQYRSAIFYHSPEQKKIAEEAIADLEKQNVFDQPIVTQVAPLGTFYRAEDYHQGYFRNNPSAGYCRAVVAPKVAKLRKHFVEKLNK
jgi:peptide-methionine (S)-S-oxide reductase